MKRIDSFTVLLATISSLTFFIFGVGITALFALFAKVSDLASLIAAFGTIGTLVLLLLQNQKTQQRLEEKDEEDRQLKKAQYLGTRKENFETLLREIEAELDSKIEFTDRLELYRSIYPKSSENLTNYKSVDQHFKDDLKLAFANLVESCNNIDSNTDSSYFGHELDFMDSISKILDILKFNFKERFCLKDMRNGRSILVATEIQASISTIYKVVNILSDELEICLSLEKPTMSVKVLEDIKRNTFKTWGQLGANFSMNLPSYAQASISAMYSLWELALSSELTEKKLFYYNTSELNLLFCNTEYFNNIISTKKDLLERVIKEVNYIDLFFKLKSEELDSGLTNYLDELKFRLEHTIGSLTEVKAN
ncbi:hypothetical protein [Vibrio splendidus]|uniref:hypothetical protein n=1 Tax=Vibrio splendidus TaxID=29497 RepID=UPI000C83E817|nr:hypothetical protein [Vibrio splendidus]PMK36907.1 hypothetical protein BCU01_03750 [Vibrio splendidus]